MKQVRMSMKPVLPSLRPISPATLSDTPRGIKPPSKLGVPVRYSSDFVVDRNLFTHSPRQKRMLIPASSSEDKASDEKTDSSPKPSDIQLLEELVSRIPDTTAPDSSFSIDDVFIVSPVLDRILCVVSTWSPKQVMENVKYQIVTTLQNRLFALIDVDDFLLRTIICRIILCLALDPSSSLLLPVARIFFKLSCSNSSDPFFFDESLDDVLLSMILNSPLEAKVFAAGALKNVAGYLPMADRLAQSNIIDIVMDCITDNSADDTLKVQMLGTVKSACKSSLFKVKLQKSKLLSRAAGDPVLFNDVLRTVAGVPGLPADEKVKIISFIPKKDITEESDIDLTTKSFLVLAQGIENKMECANASLFLIKKTAEYPEHQLAALQVAAKCCETEALIPIFEKDDTIVKLLTSEERDMELGIASIAIVKFYKDPSFDQIKEDYIHRFDF